MNLNQFNLTHVPLPVEAVYSNRLIVSGRISRISVYDVPVIHGTEWAKRDGATLADRMADALMQKVESDDELLPYESSESLGFNLGSALDHRDYGILVEQGFKVSTMEAFEPNPINITDIALRSMATKLKKLTPFTSALHNTEWFDQDNLPAKAVLVTKTNEIGHFEYELPCSGLDLWSYQSLRFEIATHGGFPMVTDVYNGKNKLVCVDKSTTHQHRPTVDIFLYH